MTIKRNGTATKYSFLHNGNKLKKGYHNGSTVIWTAGDKVTYHVDTGVSYVEEVDDGATCLAPKTFTPSKSGWTFIGWREDTAAASTVLTSKVMDGAPVTLYAVYEQTITSTFISYNDTKTCDGTRYYNASGDVEDATIIAVTGAEYSGWTWRGWSADGDTGADVAVTYDNGETISGLTGNVTYYGLYKQTVTKTFKSYNKSEDIPGTRYYNAAGNSKDPSITVPTGASYSGWTWRGWSADGDTAADAAVSWDNGDTMDGATTNTTYYGLYSQTITLSYNGNSSTSGSVSAQTGTRYYNAADDTKNPSFELASNGFSRTYHEWRAWAQDSASGTQRAAGDSVELSADTTFYAVWEEVILNIFTSGSTGDYTGSWTGSAHAADSLTNSAQGTWVSTPNNCSAALNVAKYKRLVWKGSVITGGTYGGVRAYLRIGSSVGGSQYYNKELYNNYPDGTSTSFNETVDLSSINGNIYVSVLAEADGNVAESGVSISVSTSDIKAYMS